MAITFTFGNVKLANLTTVRTEINRLRTKHSLATTTFTADTAFAQAVTMEDLKTKISGLDASQWIPDGSINVSTIPTFVSGLKISETDFNSMSSVLATVDAICAYDANFANYINNVNNSVCAYDNWC